jgi:hypothetical protein
MSGIDIPIKKFELVPRDTYKEIRQEVEEREAKKRARDEAEAKERAAMEMERKRLEQIALVKTEVDWIIAKIGSEFSGYKNKLMMRESSHATFVFSHFCSETTITEESWGRIVQQARSDIENLVPTSGWEFTYRQLRCVVSLVVPWTDQTQ